MWKIGSNFLFLITFLFMGSKMLQADCSADYCVLSKFLKTEILNIEEYQPDARKKVGPKIINLKLGAKANSIDVRIAKLAEVRSNTICAQERNKILNELEEVAQAGDKELTDFYPNYSDDINTPNKCQMEEFDTKISGNTEEFKKLLNTLKCSFIIELYRKKGGAQMAFSGPKMFRNINQFIDKANKCFAETLPGEYIDRWEKNSKQFNEWLEKIKNEYGCAVILKLYEVVKDFKRETDDPSISSNIAQNKKTIEDMNNQCELEVSGFHVIKEKPRKN